ncbi:MAG: hypothetical protein QNJ78_08330 [Gammaproteobacteria bacterium]|nr:hypothetical protein [Gammaproteobacteria bacterium]
MSVGNQTNKLNDQLENLLDAGHLNSPAPMDGLAKSLNMSTRTLRRRLAKQQTTFSQIIEKWRISTATQLLLQPDIRVQTIA